MNNLLLLKMLNTNRANTSSSKKVVDLVLFSGQSNSSGQGNYEKATTLNDGEGYEFNVANNTIVKAVEPFGATQTSDPRTGGMTTSIMKAYYALTSRPIVGVTASVSGSGIDEWQQGTNKYNKAKNDMLKAKNYLTNNGYEIEHIFMVWCQGEHEGNNNGTYESYAIMFKNMFEAYKTDVGVERIFVVRIGNATNNPTLFKTIQDAQTRLCKKNYEYVLASTKLADFLSRDLMNTTYHYDQEAYNETGFDVGKNIAYYYNTGKEPALWDKSNNNMYVSESEFFNFGGGGDFNLDGLKEAIVDSSLNLFNKNTVLTNEYVGRANGQGPGYQANTNWPYLISSDYIPVISGHTYEWSGAEPSTTAVFFDENKTFVKEIYGAGSSALPYPSKTEKAPTNSAYLRININTNHWNLDDVYVHDLGIVD